MNLTLPPGLTCRSTLLDARIETRLSALTERLPSEEAVGRVIHHHDSSPRYQGSVLISVTWTDLQAAACNHRSRGAVPKALDLVEGQVAAHQRPREAQQPGRFLPSLTPRLRRGK